MNDMNEPDTCSRCGCTEVLTIEGNIGLGGAGSNIPVGWRALDAVPVTRLVCSTCGFTESWVRDEEGLEELRARYGRDAIQQGDAADAASRRL